MKIKLFSPVLFLLIITLIMKMGVVVRNIDHDIQGDYYANSMIVDTAYATNAPQVSNKQNEIEAKKEISADVTDHSKSQNINNGTIAPVPAGADISKKGNITNAEMKLLKELSVRRQQLEKNDEELKMRTQVLQATEGKIEQKINELKTLQAKVEGIMKQYDKKESTNINSLVKIYENMKPRDAAKIFDELEMPILVRVVNNMKEIRVAPIIAAMSPMKARDLSLELARQRTLND